MATTKYKIAEQVMRMLKGNPVVSGRFHMNDVKLLVEQVANKLTKAEHFSVNMADGDSIPPNCMIYTYDSVAVTTDGLKSKCTLPSIPINLPRNMGVFHISEVDSPDDPFIPIPSGLYGIVKVQDLLGSLSGLIGYEVFGSTVMFTEDLPGLGINNVMIRLVGMDISTVSDYDLLPLSSDMEFSIVDTVYKTLITAPVADRQKTTND